MVTSNMKKSLLKRILKKKPKRSPFCSAVIAAAGNSTRMNGTDKLFLNIHGVPVIAHTLTAFQKSESINEIIIVTRQDSINRISDLCEQYHITKANKIMVGGSSRLESVFNGVTAVSSMSEIIAINSKFVGFLLTLFAVYPKSR